MNGIARRQDGFGLVVVLMALAFVVALAVAMTVSLGYLGGATARHAQAIRARELAEAGVESALSRLHGNAQGPAAPLRFGLGKGTCEVTVGPVEGHDRARRIVSTGTLMLAGGRMTSEITLRVEPAPDDPGAWRILSRSEKTRYVRAASDQAH